MLSIQFIDGFLKDFFINICVFYVFVKIHNYKIINYKRYIIFEIVNFFISIVYAFFIIHHYTLLGVIISFFMLSILITCVVKVKIEESLFASFVSLGISYIFYTFSVLLVSVILSSIFEDFYNTTIMVCIIFIFELFLLNLFFKIKRFKNGFSFLKEEKYNKFKFVTSITILILFLFYNLLKTYKKGVNESIMCIIILISISFIVFIKKQITLSYKQMLKEDTITQLEKDLEAEKLKSEKISHELEVLAKINHKYSTRISALESYVNTFIKKLNNNFNTEFADELFNAKELVEKLSKEYTTELSEEFKYAKKLPKTNNLGLDNIINYLNAQVNKDNIEFDLKINFEISCLVDNVIPQNKLETLIADHIKDAIIAINHSDSNARNILLVFDKINECYEIKIYDTGIEFEIDTLLKLGLQTITTHKDEGGSGIGFMTTFETLKDCNASLIIEEYENNPNNYTKSITIRFDGKSQYKIRSYRAYIIKNQSIDDRIVIEKL